MMLSRFNQFVVPTKNIKFLERPKAGSDQWYVFVEPGSCGGYVSEDVAQTILKQMENVG